MSEKSGEFRQRLKSRLRHFDLLLDEHQLQQLDRYYEILSRWNERINLTAFALRDIPDEALDRLVIEPLLAAELVEDSPLRWFDLGSGSGSPAIPFKVVRPTASATLVESVGKKSAFLREAVHAVGLTDVNVLTARIEELPSRVPQSSVDLVTIRAVRIDESVAQSITFLLKSHGRLLLFSEGPQQLSGFTATSSRPLVKPGDMAWVFVREP